MKTKIIQTPLKDLVTIEIDYFKDHRGFFIEPWNKRDFAKAGLDIEFVQEGHSRSKKNTLRGLHYQDMSAPMGKLARCTFGVIYDVSVDLRANSPTFGKWFGIKLTARNKKQVYIPVGFANGFVALTNFSEKQYKQTGYYTPSSEGTIAWDDPDLAVKWPIQKPILSDRDKNGMSLKKYLKKPAFKYP